MCRWFGGMVSWKDRQKTRMWKSMASLPRLRSGQSLTMRPGKAGKVELPASQARTRSPCCCNNGTGEASRAARISSRDQRGRGAQPIWGDGLIAVCPPMGSNEDAVDHLVQLAKMTICNGRIMGFYSHHFYILSVSMLKSKIMVLLLVVISSTVYSQPVTNSTR